MPSAYRNAIRSAINDWTTPPKVLGFFDRDKSQRAITAVAHLETVMNDSGWDDRLVRAVNHILGISRFSIIPGVYRLGKSSYLRECITRRLAGDPQPKLITPVETLENTEYRTIHLPGCTSEKLMFISHGSWKPKRLPGSEYVSLQHTYAFYSQPGEPVDLDQLRDEILPAIRWNQEHVVTDILGPGSGRVFNMILSGLEPDLLQATTGVINQYLQNRTDRELVVMLMKPGDGPMTLQHLDHILGHVLHWNPLLPVRMVACRGIL